MKRFVCGVLVIALLLILGAKLYENGQMHEMEKIEHEVDTMAAMQGIYEGEGIIVTNDGNEWDVPNGQFTNGLEVTVVFQTYGEPVEQWEIVSVYGNM